MTRMILVRRHHRRLRTLRTLPGRVQESPLFLPLLWGACLVVLVVAIMAMIPLVT
jgi:hypothetical protein